MEDTWNPEDPKQKPAWRSPAVLRVLRGIEFEKGDVHFARGSKSEGRYAIRTINFTCGCVAADDTGWASCGEGLHAALSADLPRSPIVIGFMGLRSVFDAVLAEAWQRRGGEPDHYYEFREAQMKARFLPFEKWKETADLRGQNVWQSGDLVAGLTAFPDEEEIALCSGGTSKSEFVLELRSENGCKVIPDDIPGAIATSFAD